jgi:general secretion pathway protein E
MTYSLATAEPVFLMSLVKPVLFVAVLLGWGRVVSTLDKDSERFYLKRKLWNLAHIGAGILGFGLLLLVPIFIVGLVLCVMIVGGVVFGYVFYRNNEVPKAAKWELSLDFIREKMETRGKASAQKHASVVLMKKDETRLPVPSRDNPNAEAHTLLENLFDFALPRNADRIDILVEPSKAAVVARIDGVAYPQPEVEPALAMRVVDYLKSSAGLDLAERRKKLSAFIKVDAGDLGRHTLDISTSGSSRGLSLIINIDPDLRTQMPLEQLGLLEPQQKKIRGLLSSVGGVAIVAAPPKQGTTTTLYSMLSEHDPYTCSVVTLEDQITWELEGVNHIKIDETMAPEKFNEKMLGIFRADPQVLYLTRFADSKSPAHVARGSEECRVYLPLEADDTFSALRAWIKLVGDRKLGAKSITAVIAQRLVRRLCHTCRTPFVPDPAALKKLNLPGKVEHIYNASGKVMVKDKPQACPDCMGLGYRGRVGVFEVMLLDDQARKYIANKEDDKLRAHLRRQRMLWLQEAALAKVVEGITDIKEVTRALSNRAPGRSSKRRSSSSREKSSSDKPKPVKE